MDTSNAQTTDATEKLGEKRANLPPTEEETVEPLEKKPKLDNNTDNPSGNGNEEEKSDSNTNDESKGLEESNLEGIELEIPEAAPESENTTTTDDFTQLQFPAPSESGSGSAGGEIPFAPGYDPLQNNLITAPLAPVQVSTRRPRRRKSELLTDAFQDPENKWSVLATERLIALYADFGKRRILDEKLHDEIVLCLEHKGNPAVTLMSEDGTSFFTYLTVAAECGDFNLVKKFLTEFREEFTEYDFKASLNAALSNKQQEIAKYLLDNTEVVPDKEAVLEMFDIAMNDDSEWKVLPLRAFLTRCIDTNRYPAEEFFTPQILNRAIYAHNVAALEVLFEEKKEEFLPQVTKATGNAKIIRSRGKSSDIGEGVPPLVYAAVMERIGCLEVLLKAGADPNFMWNDMGGTLLHIVGQKGNTAMTELLIEYNADPRIPNAQMVLPLNRTKGRKARKAITDAIASLNQLDGIVDASVPLPSHHLHLGMSPVNNSSAIHIQHAPSFVPMSSDPTVVISEGHSPFNPLLASSGPQPVSTITSSYPQQITRPTPFAGSSIVDIPSSSSNVPYFSSPSQSSSNIISEADLLNEQEENPEDTSVPPAPVVP